MFGIKTNWEKKDYRIPETIVFHLDQDVFSLQSEYLSIWKLSKVGIELDLIVSDFDNPSNKLSDNLEGAYIDLDYKNLVHSEEWEWEKKLEEFRRLEVILKKEGII
ncbi:hypothetical protein [Sphingobacterium lumbrici]|uniref:hypothetical protein n=1 Tax=Sphingobacterium lumbrici TaxID=2559600 RepID=UPI00112AC875|nr:hypothetical protein [Sphingobacterium lumbrici]